MVRATIVASVLGFLATTAFGTARLGSPGCRLLLVILIVLQSHHNRIRFQPECKAFLGVACYPPNAR